jgi:hypothetical protein
MPKDLMVQDAAALKARFLSVRGRSEAWVEGLSAEDLCVQTMDDVSPGKWHLAHVTWFWETFLLQPSCPGYKVFDKRFNFCLIPITKRSAPAMRGPSADF